MAYLPPFPPLFETDPGAPYFYKARPTRTPYVLANPIIGKALAMNFLYGYRYALQVKRTVEGFIPQPTPHINKGADMLDGPVPDYKRKGDSYSPKGETPYIVDLSKKIAIWLWDDYQTQESGGTPYMYLDFIPKALNFDVSSNLRSIGLVGVNYPHLHYTGSHETLSFSISWYDTMADQDRVAVKCRKLEALSKADGYSSGPKKIFIDWGKWESTIADSSYDQDYDTLLGGHVYTVQSANYELKDFMQHRQSKSQIINNKLRPLHATQELILKREAVQLTSKQIIDGTIL